MPLPSSGPISLTMIQTEFGGTAPISITEYYRGGTYVPNTATNANIPTSGTISLHNFYGSAAGVPTPVYQSTTLPTATADQNALTNNLYGQSVAISSSGLELYVSAPGATTSSGVGGGFVYRYTRPNTSSTFSQTNKFSNTSYGAGIGAGGFFGRGIVTNTSGNQLVVTNPGYTSSSPSLVAQGTAGYFTFSPISYQGALLPTAAQRHSNDSYGSAVTIGRDDQVMLISASGYDVTFGDAGAVFYFSRLTGGASWPTPTLITPPEPVASGNFGTGTGNVPAMAASTTGGTLAIGQIRNAAGVYPQNAGAVFVYNGTSYVQKLVASDPALGASFGQSVSINHAGTIMAVGCPSFGSLIGKVYIFTKSGGTWSQATSFSASDGAVGDRFGFSVKLNSTGTILVVGATTATVSGITAGAAYVYTGSGASWSLVTKLAQPAPRTANDNFGNFVDIASTSSTVVVGSMSADAAATNAGAVYIYQP